MKNLIPFVAGVAIASATIVTAQSTEKGQRRQSTGGISRLLMQAGATAEQIKQFNDARLELRNAPNYRTALQAELKDILTKEQYTKFEEVWSNRGQDQSNIVSAAAPVATKWKTVGFRQANTMGGGEAAISNGGKLRVFVLMGQSNMTGTARAAKLKSPYIEKHDRIRVWANGRWEYFVPRNRFGPGVSMAHQLADLWPNDTIGIIKISDGGTGVRAFEKNWSIERAQRTFDGKKGSFYKDLMNAVTEAKKVSQPEFSGFIWKQGAADGTRKDLADEYYDTFKLLVSDLRTDLSALNMPVFILSTMNDQDLLKVVLEAMSDEDVVKAKESASKPPLNDADLLKVLLAYMHDLPKARKLAPKWPYIATVIMAQNRAGREIPNVVNVHHGKLPVGQDGIHLNAEGQIKLGKTTASAVEELYKANR